MNSASTVTGPVNLGNTGEVTMRELAESVLRLTESRSQIAFRPLPQVEQSGFVGVGQRPQQHAADDAEERGIGADAQRQRQDGRE